MRVNANWQDAQPGVLLFMPATRVSVEETGNSLSQLSVTDDTASAAQSQVSNISDTVLPSCEDEANVQIKDEPTETSEFDLVVNESPATLAGDNNADIDEEMLVDVSPDAASTPESSASTDIMFQLMEAAAGDSSPHDTPAAASAAEYDAAPDTDDLLEVDYDSDRTDFRESPSPSVRRARTNTERTTGAISRHFRRPGRTNAVQPPVRRLNLGTSLKKQASKKAKDAKVTSFADLDDAEKKPRHEWKDDERILLCILYRWYDSDDATTIPKVFNVITGLNLRHHIIQLQFKGHLCYYGPKAIAELDRVYRIPFDDPQGCYAEIRAFIEEQALINDLELRKCDTELHVEFGGAGRRGSPSTKEKYRDMVRKRKEERTSAVNLENIPNVSDVLRPIMPGAVLAPVTEDSEVLANAEDAPRPVSPGPFQTLDMPALAFRVWDENSRAQFSEERGFVTEWFARTKWNGPPVAPFKPEGEGLKALLMFMTLHMSMESEVPSPFASVATSLLQALVKATRMANPRIAIIDLRHPCLQQPHKILHVSKVLPWLREHHQALWARYKGHSEWIVWADIPKEAIKFHFELAELDALAHNNPTCAEFLSLDIFEPQTSTGVVAAALREKNAQLDTTTARSMGIVAKTFGMGGCNVTLEHMQDFVARLIDGFSITMLDTVDIHTMSSISAAFATTLGSHKGGFALQEVMAAFMTGVDQGMRCIGKWSKSRSGSRRQRFRHA